MWNQIKKLFVKEKFEPPADLNSEAAWRELLIKFDYQAAEFLKQHATEEQIPMLIALARDESQPVSTGGIFGLSRHIAHPDVQQYIRDSLLTSEEKLPAAFMLCCWNLEAIRPIVLELLGSGKPKPINWGARLVRLTHPDSETERKAVWRLLRAPSTEPCTIEYLGSAVCEGQASGEDLEELAEILRRDLDIDQLRRDLDSSDPEVVVAAAKTLGKTGHLAEEAVPRLLKLIHSEGDFQWRVFEALETYGPYAASAAETVLEFLDAGDLQRPAWAKRALIHFGADAFPVLKKAIYEDERTEVRRRLGSVLGAMLEQPHGYQWLQLRETRDAFFAIRPEIVDVLGDVAMNDPDDRVRWFADHGLTRAEDGLVARAALGRLRALTTHGSKQKPGWWQSGSMAGWTSLGYLVETVMESGTEEQKAEARSIAEEHEIALPDLD